MVLKRGKIMKKKEVKKDLLIRHFRLLMHIWEHDRKGSRVESKKITEEERIHVENFLFWLQEQNCQIQSPEHFAAKIEYFKAWWVTVMRVAKEKAG
jgi:hypothetical protein